jgi:hypothetical protein
MERQMGWIGRICETVRYRRLPRSLATRYVASRNYSPELTPDACRRLRRLDRKGFTLALRIFAYDARKTTAAIMELSRRGELEEALIEKAALTGRTLGGWALETAGLPQPHDSLFELADPLGIGLGTELRRWLLNQDNWFAEADAWFRAYGPAIERFERASKRD